MSFPMQRTHENVQFASTVNVLPKRYVSTHSAFGQGGKVQAKSAYVVVVCIYDVFAVVSQFLEFRPWKSDTVGKDS